MCIHEIDEVGNGRSVEERKHEMGEALAGYSRGEMRRVLGPLSIRGPGVCRMMEIWDK